MSFTIFAKARPVKTAFILNESAEFDAVCDGLARWSAEFWGSRQGIVALLNENSLTDDAWQELIHFDPDNVYSFAPISDKLLEELNARLSPWHIREPQQHRIPDEPKTQTNATIQNNLQWIVESIQSGGIPVPPTEQNLKAIPIPAITKNPLLLFNFDKNCPLSLRRFIHRNFGTYDQWFDLRTGAPRYLGWMEDLLKKIPGEQVEQLLISDLPSLCAAMERMSGTPPQKGGWKPAMAFTVPCELSSIHLSKHYLAKGAFDHKYRIIVGSQLQDFVFYWRNCVNEGDGAWREPFRHCLWVPSELVQEPTFVAALKNWLYRFTGQGNSNNRTVELTSVSLSSNDLTPLADAMRAGTFRVPIRLETVEKIEEWWRNERAQHQGTRHLMNLHNDDSVQRIQADERTLTRELRPPKVIQDDVPMGKWAVDIQIEREPREGGMRDQDWWLLPRRSGRSLVASMFRVPARICRSGLFAIPAERTSTWSPIVTTPHFKIQLPADDEVLPCLLSLHLTLLDYGDAREKRLKFNPVITDVRISDAGRKLRGLIELFGGFWHAQNYWERACWREIFCRMAGRGAEYDTDFCSQTEATIQKELRQLASISDDARTKMSQRITRRVLGIVGERLPGIPMSFVEMEEERARFEQSHGKQNESPIQYVAGDTIVHRTGVEPVTQEEFKQGLEELVRLDVLRMGMNVRCPRCRLQHWIKADALRQSDSCPGCGSTMLLAPETAWHYRLNPLVHRCVNSRALAVWQALAELAHRPSSFFYTPSAELTFVQPINGSQIRELDVLSVTNGELLIGEVKDGDVERGDFEKFAAIAQTIRPDRAAMFVPEGVNVDGWFKQFREQLAPLGIRGELFQLPTY